MTTQHTPGPWCVKGGTPLVGIDRPYDIIAGASLIAQTLIAPERSAAAANAQLIAAAPEMLAALQALTITARTFRNVSKENQDWTAYDDMALDNAFAIIARATGAAQ